MYADLTFNIKIAQMKYTPRVIEKVVRQYLKQFPAIGLTGPRQAGKSTLLQHLFADYNYVTFDDPIVVSQFEADPYGFMLQHDDKVIFDEAQYVPDIFRYIKINIDNDRQTKSKFIITGSSQFSFIKNIRESLAGRIGLLSLLPFQYSELPKNKKKQAYFKGSYPEVILDTRMDSRAWYASYFDTYLHKDIATLTQVGDLRDFRRFVQLLAANVAQQLNMSSLASDLGVSVPTIKRWISVLEASYIIFLLPPYYKNYNKRIVKSPKLYFYDSGLVNYLLEITDPSFLERGPLAGHLFENYMISEIKKREVHQASQRQLYYLRTAAGDEVDLILDCGEYSEWIEIKNSATPKPAMLKPMKQFMASNDKGYLVYRGEDVTFSDQLAAINFSNFLEA
ncbi:MAG: hypothetical protein COB66_08890 [Coxiella sp. (in: Bacteria)]|nr:MAG: hypothetical protein COB66_08890 [Coxiella sp. (in: g-proteobacteria)]